MRFDEAQLPAELLSFLKRKGFSDLYPPQEAALKNGLLTGESLVMASPTACYDGKTEVLTRSGWKPFKDTSPNEEVLSMNPETLEMEYVRAVDKIRYFYRGRMVHVQGKEIDFRVTENHNMFVHHRHKLALRDPKTARFIGHSGLCFDFHPAREISPNWKFVTGGVWKGKRDEYLELPAMMVRGRYPPSKRPLPPIRIPMHDFLNFFGWYVAEGSTKFGNGDYEVTLCQKKDPVRAKAALAKLDIGRVYTTGPKNHKHFSVSSPQLARYLSQFGKAFEKFVPSFVKELSPDQIRTFLDSYFRGDGHAGRDGVSVVFDTTSKRLADDIQELLLKVGTSSSVRFRGRPSPHAMPDGHIINPKHPVYEVVGRRYSEHGFDYRKPSKPSFETTNGERVYCLTLPKYHLLYVRRNGKALWCGNSGKTLIAIMAAFTKAKVEGRKVVYLAPLRALASEKYSEFSELSEFGLRTAISTGDYDLSGESLGRADIIVLTNERFDSIMRHKVSWLDSVGLFIADEVHLAGSDSRGPTLEMILTKIIHLGLDAQLLSLSATISNAKLVAQWLNSKPIELDWRPVPLRQGVFDYGSVVFTDGEKRAIARSTYGPSIDVAMDAVKGGGQSLVFASTRRRAVSLATKAAEATQRYLSEEEKRALSEASRRILTSGEETSLSRLLAEIVAKGSAFHHAGLGGEHRRIVEDYFRARAIKVLASTPTLCLPEGEEVFGNPRTVPIQTLGHSDRVMTHAGRFMPVISPISREYRGNLLRVTPWGQLPMRMTPEHRVLRVIRTKHSIHNGRVNKHWWAFSEPEWVEARNLRRGDLVLFPVIKDETDIEYIDLPKRGRLANQTGSVGEHWSRLCVSRIPLDSETMEVMGLYVAEGYSGRQGQVMYAISQTEVELTRRITHWFRSIGLRPVVMDSTRHRRVLRACSKQLGSKFRELFGESAETKRMPHSFVLLPEDKLIRFIRGMWCGDGTADLTKNRSARYSTTSPTLAKQLFAALVKIGYMPCLSKRHSSGKKGGRTLGINNKHDLYTISISGSQLRRFSLEVLGIKGPKIEGNRTYNLGHRDSNYYYMPVRSIDTEPFSGRVYNLEVEADSSYVGSFVVHNSMGVNLPARRVVIADTLRYDVERGGNSEISILEYRQMAGRAGRPQYDDYGETVLIPPQAAPAKEILEHFANAAPEPIESKLSDERAMRVHTLATIASSVGLSKLDVQGLFGRTLLARQIGQAKVGRLIESALGYLLGERLLEERGPLFHATDFGRRVSMLYIDPVTGVQFREALRKASPGKRLTAGFLYAAANSPDFEPKFPLRSKDFDQAALFMEEHAGEMIERPSRTTFAEFDEVLQGSRSVMALHGWIEEWREEQLLDRLGVEPGDMHRAVDNADWLLHSMAEIAKLFKRDEMAKQVELLRRRVENGVSEELVELTALQGVGRVRARALYSAGFRTMEDLKEASADKIAMVGKVGTAVARRIKEQVSKY